MPITELRETIRGSMTLDASGSAYYTKRIQVPEGMRNQILQVDLYNDNVGPWLSNAGEASGFQVYLSPYPTQRTAEDLTLSPTVVLPEAGPTAGDDSVLYKETSIYTLDDFNEQSQNKIWTNRFPNDCISANPTNTFYSSHLYLTLIVWNQPETEIEFCYSIYAKIKQTKCNSVESTMGRYAEFLDAQIRLLSLSAVMTPTALIAGNTFPTWRFGGIRPELMISGTTALRYFNRVASNANQDMIERGGFQTAFQEATTMAAFNDPFGDPTVPIPAWIKLMDVSGITSGAIRPYAPPLKFDDNGNTLMF